MSTESQIKANQKNAKHSTGPRTEEGKSASSLNSFRHGLSSAAIIMLPHENAETFVEFAAALRLEHEPVTITEDALVAKMAQSLWLSTRAVNLQSLVLAESVHPDARLLALYMRYQSLHDRTFSKSLAELQKMRQSARQQEIGSASQILEKETHAVKIRALTARSESTESITHLRKSRNAQYFSPGSSPAAPRHAA